MKWKEILKDIAGIVALSAVVGFAYNSFNAKGVSLIRTEAPKETISDSLLFGSSAPSEIKEEPKTESVQVDTAKPKTSEPVKETAKPAPVKNEPAKHVQQEEQPAGGYRIITFDQFARLVKEKRALILDAREPEEYKAGRVPGAINVPYLSVDQYFEQIAQYPRDTLIAIYCNNLMCPLGKGLAEFMAQLEFKKLLLYEQGWDYWEREEMPIEK